MLRKVLPLLLIAGAAGVAMAQTHTPVMLKSVSVELPDNLMPFPPGPNVETINNDCRACHSVEMVLNQPRMAQAAWSAEVAKMRNVYKAPVPQADDAAIVEYLTAVKGPK